MKVLLINGSPHNNGCTFTALSEVEKELQAQGIETQIYHIGTQPVRGCTACGSCYKTGKCAFDDGVNEISELIKMADGVVIGTPVYYSSMNGALSATLDRVFYSAGSNFKNKPAAGVVSCRRGGASATFDQLNKYFTISNMPVVSSQYWNAVHGRTAQEVKRDLEGLQIMRTLGKNMTWLLQNIEQGKDNVTLPVLEDRIATNFIR